MIDLMAALDADHRSNPVHSVNPPHVGGGVRHFEVGRISGRHPLDQIHLFQRRLDCLEALQIGRHPHRPELPPHLSGAQARNVGHQRRGPGGKRQPGGVRSQIDGRQIALETVADLPRQIVMAVDQRRAQ